MRLKLNGITAVEVCGPESFLSGHAATMLISIYIAGYIKNKKVCNTFIMLLNFECHNYSVRRLLTGLAMAAFMACMLTVNKAIRMATTPATTNTHQLMLMR